MYGDLSGVRWKAVLVEERSNDAGTAGNDDQVGCSSAGRVCLVLSAVEVKEEDPVRTVSCLVLSLLLRRGRV